MEGGIISSVKATIRTVVEIPLVLWRDIINTVKGYHQRCGGNAFSAYGPSAVLNILNFTDCIHLRY